MRDEEEIKQETEELEKKREEIAALFQKIRADIENMNADELIENEFLEPLSKLLKEQIKK